VSFFHPFLPPAGACARSLGAAGHIPYFHAAGALSFEALEVRRLQLRQNLRRLRPENDCNGIYNALIAKPARSAGEKNVRC
jgi:hypothetical protein